MAPDYSSDFSSQKQVNRNKTLELLKGTKPFLRFFSSFLFLIDKIPLGLPPRLDYPCQHATLPRVPAAAHTFEVNHFYGNLAPWMYRGSWEALS